MFAYDERTTDMVLDLARDRLRSQFTPLDHSGNRKDLESALAGLITPEGRDPAEVLDVYTEHLAPAIISTDSPRYLAFIPAAPTKASLLFDVIVSCLLHRSLLLADHRRGDRGGEPGARVPGRSCRDARRGRRDLRVRWLGREPLGAPRRRDTAAYRRGSDIVGRPCAAVSDEAHSSVAKALHVIGVDALVVPTTDHRLTETDLRGRPSKQTGTRSRWSADVATAGTTNVGIVD